MKKNQIFTILALCWALLCSAQQATGNRPYWISSRPQTDSKSMYYYRVTQGEGANYDKAYANAFAKAILESSWKLGVEVNTSDDLQTIEKGVTDNITVESSRITLPLNKVCEYIEPTSGKMGTRIYILWQVAKFGNRTPNFEEFTKCE